MKKIIAIAALVAAPVLFAQATDLSKSSDVKTTTTTVKKADAKLHKASQVDEAKTKQIQERKLEAKKAHEEKVAAEKQRAIKQRENSANKSVSADAIDAKSLKASDTK